MGRQPSSRGFSAGRVRWRAVLGPCLVLAACSGRSETPRWIQLSQGFQPRELLSLAQGWHAGSEASDRILEVLHGVRIEHLLHRSDWTAGEDGAWSTPLPRGAFDHGTPGFLTVGVEGATLSPENGAEQPGPGKLALADGRLRMTLPPGELPPELMTLSQRLEHGRPGPSGFWQVRTGPLVGAGIPVWSGEREELRLDLPAASRLNFVARWSSRQTSGPVVFRVRLDGETRFEEAFEPAALAGGAFRAVLLPASGRSGARLAFEVEGPGGLGVFYDPVVGPAETGRRHDGERPDLVLFLADTLRADSLAIHGGAPDLAPNLNAFAQRSSRCLRARAPAAWTLPSIATLLTGLAPGQHGANDTDEGLAPELETIAEALLESGYRTGAITDGCFFSHFYGLDQGFEWFVQRSVQDWSLENTLEDALAFLEHDDGRPVFLVVHTYRTHMPYRAGDEESQDSWQALLDRGCGLMNHEQLPPEEQRRRFEDCAPLYRPMYEEGVRALDRGFGRFEAELDRRGFYSRGVLAFTSDHGEALGENDDIFHAGDLWEVKLAVPLLLHGQGIEPGEVARTVGLADIAPTLARLARLPQRSTWTGVPLITYAGAPAGERPSYAFRLQKTRTQVAVVEGQKKILTGDPARLAQGHCDQAFDLALDPREEHDLAREASWPAEIARRVSRDVSELLVPRVQSPEVGTNPELQHTLDALGYGGGD